MKTICVTKEIQRESFKKNKGFINVKMYIFRNTYFVCSLNSY